MGVHFTRNCRVITGPRLKIQWIDREEGGCWEGRGGEKAFEWSFERGEEKKLAADFSSASPDRRGGNDRNILGWKVYTDSSGGGKEPVASNKSLSLTLHLVHLYHLASWFFSFLFFFPRILLPFPFHYQYYKYCLWTRRSF